MTTAVATTTTLPDGPPAPSAETLNGLPLRVTVTSGQIIANEDNHTELTYTVPVSAIIWVVMDNALADQIGASTDFEIPSSVDSSVAERISDRTDCPANHVCATFAAVQVGKTLIGSMGPAGNGIMAAYFAFQLIVV